MPAYKHEYVAELIEALDNTTAALETVLAHYGQTMPAADLTTRTRVAKEARETLAKEKSGRRYSYDADSRTLKALSALVERYGPSTGYTGEQEAELVAAENIIAAK